MAVGHKPTNAQSGEGENAPTVRNWESQQFTVKQMEYKKLCFQLCDLPGVLCIILVSLFKDTAALEAVCGLLGWVGLLEMS